MQLKEHDSFDLIVKSPRQPMRILVIEDDREAAGWLIKGLAESGHVADHAADGEEGLEMAYESVHDVLIVDRMLPKIDGLTIIRKLRENGNKTPVLILSALSDVDERVKGLRAGGDDYLGKPYAFSELLARVENLGHRATQTPWKPGFAPPISRSTFSPAR